jgi:hypothetical protein
VGCWLGDGRRGVGKWGGGNVAEMGDAGCGWMDGLGGDVVRDGTLLFQVVGSVILS